MQKGTVVYSSLTVYTAKCIVLNKKETVGLSGVKIPLSGNMQNGKIGFTLIYTSLCLVNEFVSLKFIKQ